MIMPFMTAIQRMPQCHNGQTKNSIPRLNHISVSIQSRRGDSCCEPVDKPNMAGDVSRCLEPCSRRNILETGFVASSRPAASLTQSKEAIPKVLGSRFFGANSTASDAMTPCWPLWLLGRNGISGVVGSRDSSTPPPQILRACNTAPGGGQFPRRLSTSCACQHASLSSFRPLP